MGTTAVRHTAQVLNHVETIMAIELLSAAQGIDFRRREDGVDRLGAGTAVAYQLIREKAPFFTEDVILAPHIEQVRQLVHNGDIKTAVMAEVEG